MLQKMGEHIHGWIAGIIVVVISVVFALWGVSYYISSTRPDQEVIAKVNGTKLIGKQLSDMFQSAITADPTLSMASPKKLAKKKLLVKQWINQQAVMTTLHKSGMVVSPELVKQFVLSIPAFQQNGQFSNLAFQSYLIQNHMNEMQFYQKVSKQIATMQFLSAIEKSTFVLPNEINHYFQLLSQQRTFKYALLSAKNYIYQVKVKAGDLKTYYQNHLDQFLVPEKVSVNYIELTPKSVANSIMITNDQIKSYYQDHIKTFTKPASWTYVTYSIASLRSHYIKENNKQIEARFNAQVAKLKNGQGINDFLKANKVDTKTSAQLAPAMVNILKGLKPGQVSKVDNSNILRGKTVFYLVSDTPKHVSSLDKVKQEVKALLTKQQISQLLSSKSDQMTNLSP